MGRTDQGEWNFGGLSNRHATIAGRGGHNNEDDCNAQGRPANSPARPKQIIRYMSTLPITCTLQPGQLLFTPGQFAHLVADPPSGDAHHARPPQLPRESRIATLTTTLATISSVGCTNNPRACV
jgi:hypothetical protein